MRKKRRTYSEFQLVSSVWMILALLWLTVSLPFVYAAQQEFAKFEQTANPGFPMGETEEEAANPFGNSTEEKAPNPSSVSEEYLHDYHKSDYFFSVISRRHKWENAATYVAFHGELLVPPPNLT